MENIVKFKKWNCKIEYGYYGNKRIAISLIDAHDGQPIATATTNIPEIKLDPDCVLIKTWAGNEGMVEALEEAGIVKDMDVRLDINGWGSMAVICKLLKYDFDEEE